MRVPVGGCAGGGRARACAAPLAAADAAGGGGFRSCCPSGWRRCRRRSPSSITNRPTSRGRSGSRDCVFGLTNRLEWFGLIGLRFAILDDRPADGRAPMPFSLAVHAGVIGIGYSSAEGMIVVPVASLTVLKHVADRWALSLVGGWRAQWVEHAGDVVRRHAGGTAARSSYSGRRGSTITLSGSGHAAAQRAHRARHQPGGRPDQRLRRPDVRLGVAERQRLGVRQRAPVGLADRQPRTRRRRSPPPGRGAADDLSRRDADLHPAHDGDLVRGIGLGGVLLAIAARRQLRRARRRR